jgi:hypothetical protein
MTYSVTFWWPVWPVTHATNTFMSQAMLFKGKFDRDRQLFIFQLSGGNSLATSPTRAISLY